MSFFSLSHWNISLETSGDSGQDHLIQSLVRNGLRKLLPPGSFFLEGEQNVSLPCVKMSPSCKEMGLCSIILVSQAHPGVERFFYEMITRWLLPGKRLTLHFFIHSFFSFLGNSSEKFSFCEARFFFQNEYEQEAILRHFPQVASEIEVGALSVYQAHRILENKALFSSEKQYLIHERMAALTRDRPEDFDYDVFGQMQHFFVASSEDFKKIREHSHLSRIIYVFYLFRKRLRKESEILPDDRHISFKVSRVRLHQPFGIQEVLGVFVGLNFLKKHEVFEEKHLLQALKEHLPDILAVEGSSFIYVHKEEKIQIIYLEIKKEKEKRFSDDEIRNLRIHFSHTLENQIEKLMPALFMPRNEEEVMKNIVRLGQELKYLKDIPQVMISFEGQTDLELTFTVILLRLLSGGEQSIQDLFKQSSLEFVFLEDRVKQVGVLRQKYQKEATVFRLKMLKAPFRRNDHSVDLLKARQAVSLAIQKMIGEFRDYNGGMIAKQAENLQVFQKLLSCVSQKEAREAEEFFHSLSPFELCAVIDPALLKTFYNLWQEVQFQEEAEFLFKLLFQQEKVLLMTRFLDEEVKKDLSGLIKKQSLGSSRTLIFSFKRGRYFYEGYLLFGIKQEESRLLEEEIKSLRLIVC